MDLQSLYNQALGAQRAGNLAEAERLYRQILEQATPPEVLVNLGNVLAAQNRREDATQENRVPRQHGKHRPIQQADKQRAHDVNDCRSHSSA